MRLNKFIALASGISRRDADDLIHSGRVEVNGQNPEIGTRVGENDAVILDGNKLNAPKDFTYILVNKPVGFVTTRNSQDGSPTIYEFIPDRFGSLKYVGRLDKESSGLLLMTNDGDFSHQMTHPSFEKEKVYLVELDHKLTTKDEQAINQGLNLDDGNSHMKVVSETESLYRVTMHQGRNRQIRRTFGVLGYGVTKLQRIKFGPYSLKELDGAEFIEVDVRR